MIIKDRKLGDQGKEGKEVKKADVFGKKRLADFYVDPDYVNVNHGSYGYCPRVVMDAKRRMEERMDFNTEKWFRYDSQQLLNQSRQLVAKRLQCPTKNLFIVQNATDAFNCLAKSLPWKGGQTIALPNTAYSSIRKTVQWLRDRYNIKILDINFTIEDFQSVEKVIIKVQDTINAYPQKISLAVIDHIISTPAIVMPVQALTEFFKEKGIPIFVDGAHAVCQVEIDLSEFTPDAYFSNFHKWAFGPKSAAFLYISDRYLDVIRPAITGNFRGQGPQRQFFWQGTRDLTAYLVLDKALQYFDSFGPNKIQQHNKYLSTEGANKMAQIWKTKKLTNDPHLIAYLNNIEVPSNNIELCTRMNKKLLDQYNCFLPLFVFDGKIFCRISAQIYNQVGDYQYAARTFLGLIKSETQNQTQTQ